MDDCGSMGYHEEDLGSSRNLAKTSGRPEEVDGLAEGGQAY